MVYGLSTFVTDLDDILIIIKIEEIVGHTGMRCCKIAGRKISLVLFISKEIIINLQCPFSAFS